MGLDTIQLTKDIVAINSVSQRSNAAVSDLLEDTLKQCAFEVERLEFVDDNGERKVSLVGKKGEGADGFGLFSHSDTVPGMEGDWNPFDPVVEDGRLIGRGSCDMKGPIAATIAAGAEIDAAKLQKPLFIVITSDEEISGLGARQVAEESTLFNAERPKHGVIAEPTRLSPVYAHKGGGRVIVTAHGRAAHTSTDKGISANFLIAPFLAEMAELATLFKTDESFMNREFNPPTNGFNMILDDGGCKPNISAAKTVCTLSFRPMPNDRSDDVIAMVTERAEKYGLEISSRKGTPFYISPDAEIVQAGLKATGAAKAGTVPFGTDAATFKDYLQLVILGPGNIAQAHTVGEWIEVAQLVESVDVYKRMIEMLCM
ncbi:MAG: M20/M25/M40 family metallo-hydrolase [Candidatus Poribacteria bacterium]|nr:M20/M25/M40 family metallo-hydrolase [Candidatus Poribacteria bacterium]